jgi:hypothetical protein
MQRGPHVGWLSSIPLENLCAGSKGLYVKGKSASRRFSFLLAGGRFKEKVLTSKAKQYNKFVHTDRRGNWRVAIPYYYCIQKPSKPVSASFGERFTCLRTGKGEGKEREGLR